MFLVAAAAAAGRRLGSSAPTLIAAALCPQRIDGAARGIVSSSKPSFKGRKGGSSILRPRTPRTTKVAGAGKKKKPKVHGEPFSRIAKDRRDEENAKRQAERLERTKWDENMPPFEV